MIGVVCLALSLGWLGLMFGGHPLLAAAIYMVPVSVLLLRQMTR
jgi:hypothetical protein